MVMEHWAQFLYVIVASQTVESSANTTNHTDDGQVSKTSQKKTIRMLFSSHRLLITRQDLEKRQSFKKES